MHILHTDLVQNFWKSQGNYFIVCAFLLPVQRKNAAWARFLNIFVNIITPPFIRHGWYAFKFTKLYTVLLTAYVNAHKFLSRNS